MKKHRNAVIEKSHLEEGEIVGDFSDNTAEGAEVNVVTSNVKNSSEPLMGLETKYVFDQDSRAHGRSCYDCYLCLERICVWHGLCRTGSPAT